MHTGPTVILWRWRIDREKGIGAYMQCCVDSAGAANETAPPSSTWALKFRPRANIDNQLTTTLVQIWTQINVYNCLFLLCIKRPLECLLYIYPCTFIGYNWSWYLLTCYVLSSHWSIYYILVTTHLLVTFVCLLFIYIWSWYWWTPGRVT